MRPMRKLLSGLALALAASPFAVTSLVACSKDNPQPTYPTASASGTGTQVGPGPTGASGNIDLDSTLRTLAAQRVPDMQPEMAPSKFDLMIDGHQKVGVNLQVGKCYAIIVAGPVGGNVDVAVTAQGTVVAQDQTQEPYVVLGAAPTVLCPPQSGELQVDVSLHNTGGSMAFALYGKQAGPATGQPTGTGMPTAWATPTGSGAPTVVPTGTTTAISTEDPANMLLRAKATTLAPWMQPEGTVFKQSLAEGGKGSFIATLTAGRCYTVVAVGGPGVTDVDLGLLLPPFYTVDAGRDKRTDSVAVIANVCPAAMFPVPYRIDVGPKKGTGVVAAQVYSKAK